MANPFELLRDGSKKKKKKKDQVTQENRRDGLDGTEIAGDEINGEDGAGDYSEYTGISYSKELSWADDSDESDYEYAQESTGQDGFYSTIQPDSLAFQTAVQRQRDLGLIPALEHEKSEGESEYESDCSDESEDTEAESVEKETPSAPCSLQERKPASNSQQISKKEQRKKDLEDLDALLDELKVSSSNDDSAKNNGEKKTDESNVKTMPTAAAAEFLGLDGSPHMSVTSSKSSKKKKKKGKKGGDQDKKDAQDEKATLHTNVDVRKLAAARSGKPKKSTGKSGAAAAAEAEAKARQAKIAAMKKKKKDTSNYNHVPLK